MDVRLALTGFGNVGQGVATLLAERSNDYHRRYGVRLLLTGVADRGGAAVDSKGLEPQVVLDTKRRTGTVSNSGQGSPNLAGTRFLEASGAQILLEAASTNFDDAEPGWSYAREGLAQGMDLVFASKGALVLHWGELMEQASSAGRIVKFSATVGAPLPELELAKYVLIGTDITGFEGILNATSNYILSAMTDGSTYAQAVRQAQDIGIAETDPTLDVDGWDAAAKAVIVANALLGADLRLSDVPRQGIRDVDRPALQEAELAGEAIKLIARATKTPNGVLARVGRERRPLADVLGSLRDDQMGVVLHAEPLGAVATTVQSTGGLATALTLLRDVVNLSRERGWAPILPK
jgi:homoserine dehydrogenase